MPITPTFPGVYIEEVPSGVRTITPVGTSTAAFVDRFRRGPLNVAVQVLSPSDFEREFGGLDPTSEASYAIQQFFQNGGSDAYVVRVGTAPIAAARRTVHGTLPGPGDAFRVVAGRQIRGHSSRTRASGATGCVWRSTTTPFGCPTRPSTPTASSSRTSCSTSRSPRSRWSTAGAWSARPSPSAT